MNSKKLDLVIIGAQKAGTTSLMNYVMQHPEVVGHGTIEFPYFSEDTVYREGFDAAFEHYFEKKEGSRLVAKNVALSLLEPAMQRLVEHNPEVKIIYLIREPASRAYSSYTMAVKNGWMQRPFSDVKDVLARGDEQDRMYDQFIGLGRYARDLRMVLRHVPPRNVRVFLFDDLVSVPQAVVDEVVRWLGLEPVPMQLEVHHKSFQPRSTAMAKFLRYFRRPRNRFRKALRAILPSSFYSWLGNQVMDLNVSNQRFAPLSPEMRVVLKEYYRPHLDELRQLVDEQEQGLLVTFSQPAWLFEAWNKPTGATPRS